MSLNEMASALTDEDYAGRMAYADLVQESGDEISACVIRAHAQHGLPFVAHPITVQEITVEKLQTDYDWGGGIWSGKRR